MLEIFILIFIGGGGAVTNVRMILCSCEKLLKLKWDTPLKLYYFFVHHANVSTNGKQSHLNVFLFLECYINITKYLGKSDIVKILLNHTAKCNQFSLFFLYWALKQAKHVVKVIIQAKGLKLQAYIKKKLNNVKLICIHSS